MFFHAGENDRAFWDRPTYLGRNGGAFIEEEIEWSRERRPNRSSPFVSALMQPHRNNCIFPGLVAEVFAELILPSRAERENPEGLCTKGFGIPLAFLTQRIRVPYPLDHRTCKSQTILSSASIPYNYDQISIIVTAYTLCKLRQLLHSDTRHIVR